MYTKQFSVSKVDTGANYSHLCYSTSITAYQTNLLDMDRKCACCLKNKAAHNRTKCASCEKRLQREKYPVKAAYYDLRTNAKRRGIFFDLTLEQFEKFCFKTEYLQGKGKTAESYSVDRIIESKGYTDGNLQVLTLSENTQKENLRRKQLVCDWETGNRKNFFTRDIITFKRDNDCPF